MLFEDRISVLCWVLATLCWTTCTSSALEFRQYDDYSTNEVVRHEIWLSAKNIAFDGKTLQDAFLCATNLALRGFFHQDLWAAGLNKALFSGWGLDDVRLVGPTIVVDGYVAGNLTALALDPKELIVDLIGWSAPYPLAICKADAFAQVEGHAFFRGQKALINGVYHGPVTIQANDLAVLQGHFATNVTVYARDIVIKKGTRIKGDLRYSRYAPNLYLYPSPDVFLKGELVRLKSTSSWDINLVILLIQLFFFVCAFLLGVPFVLIFPRLTGTALRTLRTAPGYTALTGLSVVMALFLLVMFTATSLPPCAIVLGCLLLVLVYFARFIVALLIGSLFFPQWKTFTFKKVISILAIGLLVLYSLELIPGFKWMVKWAVIFSGSGALVNAILHMQRTTPNAEQAKVKWLESLTG